MLIKLALSPQSYPNWECMAWRWGYIKLDFQWFISYSGKFLRDSIFTDRQSSNMLRFIVAIVPIHVCKSMLISSLVPRLLPTWEKGLVHTDCACTGLYSKSGYIVYSRKILSKLSIYDYVIFSNSLAFDQQTYEVSSESSFERLTGKGNRNRLSRHLFELKVKRSHGKL